MSRTEIYEIGKEHCVEIGTTQNAFRGAMYVWNDIAKRYFGLEYFPSFDEDMQRRIWNAHNEHNMPEDEIVVLLSTMDRVTVSKNDLEQLTDSFLSYAERHPNSSLGEQAKIIKETDIGDDKKIAWCQTSVCEFHFGPRYDEETDEPTYSDMTDAWDLFEQLQDIKEAA